MSSAPTSSPTAELEQIHTLNIFSIALILLVICYSCLAFGFRANHYTTMYEELKSG